MVDPYMTNTMVPVRSKQGHQLDLLQIDVQECPLVVALHMVHVALALALPDGISHVLMLLASDASL